NTTQIQIRKKLQHLLMAVLGKSNSVVCLTALVLMATVLSSRADNGCDIGPFPKENCTELCHKACGHAGVCLLGDDEKYYCCCEPVRQDGSMRPQEVAEMIQT
uniref:Uncharacterized protein n=1 Tax=Aegilops tauschii subsp. strangulata TaxID=200361 RepID=A0A453JPC5_AEGTS